MLFIPLLILTVQKEQLKGRQRSQRSLHVAGGYGIHTVLCHSVHFSIYTRYHQKGGDYSLSLHVPVKTPLLRAIISNSIVLGTYSSIQLFSSSYCTPNLSLTVIATNPCVVFFFRSIGQKAGLGRISISVELL